MEIQMQKFESNRSTLMLILPALSLALPAVVLLATEETIGWTIILTAFTLVPFALLMWISYDTVYVMHGHKLFYRSAFLRGQIEIADIREIVKGVTRWTGLRPATATKGLLIRYGASREVYISPKDNDEMIRALTQINANIKVTG